MSDALSNPGKQALPERELDLAAIRERTPARVFRGRAGLGYRTGTLLELRSDHAAARDAVQAEIDLDRDLGAAFVAEHTLFEVASQATDKQEYLRRPDLGRRLSDAARTTLQNLVGHGADLQIAVGDGLSVAAVARQVPRLLPALVELATGEGWKLGRTFLIRYCRVGIMNDVGDVLAPRVLVLLIGERPGLATAESLSAYMAYRPRAGQTDADRNLISNIHDRGVAPESAATRIVALAREMFRRQRSGYALKEVLPHLPAPLVLPQQHPSD